MELIGVQEEQRLISLWQRKGDIKARDQLIQSHLRFVVTMARKQTQDPNRLQDLISAGNLGLLIAADRYDLDKRPPPRFLTYAGWWVQKEIADAGYATGSVVHVPTHRQKAQRKQAKIFQKVLQKHGPEDLIVSAMDPGIPEGATVTLDALHDTPMEDNGSTTERNTLLRKAVNHLPLREQTVLNLFFGAKDDPRNLVQIATILEMCPERVRQIKNDGMRQLKEILEREASFVL